MRRLLAEGASPVPMVRRGNETFSESVCPVIFDYDRPADFQEALEGLDVLVQAAASNTVTKSANDPMRELDTDLRASVALVDALQRRPDIHVVFLSSGGTFYGEGRPGQLIDEKAPARPRSFHGASKAAAESFFVAWAARTGGRLTIVRPSNVYGPGQPPTPGFGVVPALLRCAASGSTFRLRGSPASVRDYLYVEDFVDLLARVILAERSESPQIFNASSGIGVQLGDLISRVEQVTGRSIEVEAVDSLRSEVDSIVLDPAMVRKHHGWRATTSLEDGLAETWKWFANRSDS